MMTCSIRRIEARDEPRWRELWDGYNRFYEREPSETITAQTWGKIMNQSAPIHAIVAENIFAEDTDQREDVHQGELVGIANYVIHDSTSSLAPICLLQDLFVDPSRRGTGAGKLLIDWLVAEMSAQGWSRLYWHTRENKYRARGLYDKYTPHSGFLRYVILNPRA
jgi:GNAT superfamily N-acetyltransferase